MRAVIAWADVLTSRPLSMPQLHRQRGGLFVHDGLVNGDPALNLSPFRPAWLSPSHQEPRRRKSAGAGKQWAIHCHERQDKSRSTALQWVTAHLFGLDWLIINFFNKLKTKSFFWVR